TGYGHAADRILAGTAWPPHPVAGAPPPAGDCRRILLSPAKSERKTMSVPATPPLCKNFGGGAAGNHDSFGISPGEFLAMIGPNGAGKSTCFNMINGQLTPDSGEILFAGRNIARLEAREVWRLGVGRTFQVAATFGSMTVIENVQMALISNAHETYRL